MIPLPIDERARAADDIDEAIRHYASKATGDIALAFLDAVDATYALLAEYPQIGSLRYADALKIPGLRHRKLPRFPWLVFYFAEPDRIEIVRLLGARRDILTILSDDTDF